METAAMSDAPPPAAAAGVRELAEAFAGHLGGLRFLDAFGLLAPHGTYTVIGTTPASGVYHGPDDLIARLVPLLADFVVPPEVHFDAPIVEGDRAVLLGRGRGVGPTGPYDQPYYAWALRAQDGVLVEVIEFMDTEMLRSAVFGPAPAA